MGNMKIQIQRVRRKSAACILPLLFLEIALPAMAQQSPWDRSFKALETSLTGPVATSLSLIAIVLGGFALAFGEGTGKRALGGMVAGCALALSAPQVKVWLFS